MKLARRAAAAAALLVLAGCASMSDRGYVAGQDGGGDYYLAPEPQGGYYYDPYGRSGFNFHFGYGWGSPFGYRPFGYWDPWIAWPYFPPPHANFVVVPDQATPSADRPRRRESRQAEWQQPGVEAPAVAAPERRERSSGPAVAPQAPARRQRRGDSPIP